MKKTLQSSLKSRVRIAWQCVGLLVLLAGVATAQEGPLQKDAPQTASPQGPPNQPPQNPTSAQPAVSPYAAQPAVSPYATPSGTAPEATGYSDPATAGQQVQLDVVFAVAADESLVRWATPHKAIIKRVASNDSRPLPLAKPAPAASRPFFLMFGSETPVPLSFDAKLRGSLLTILMKDERTSMLMTPSVVTGWDLEANFKTLEDADGDSAVEIRLKPTPIGNGELGLEFKCEIAPTPDSPGKKVVHWNLRAQVDHTLMVPLAPLNLETQLVALVVPKIVEVRPAQYSATPTARPHSLRDYPPEYRPVPQPSYAPVPPTAYPPVPQTAYRPVPQATASRSNQEMVAISADFVTGPASVVPDKMADLNPEQRKAWLNSLNESDASHREQISTVSQWGEQSRLTTPRAKGHEAPFDLLVTPTRGADGAIHLELKGTISNLRPEVTQKSGFETTLETAPDTTIILPLPVTHPDGRRVALLIQPQIVAPAPPRQGPSQLATPAGDESTAIFQMLILNVDAKTARKVVSVTPKNDEEVDDVNVPLPPDVNSKKRARTPKTEKRTFTMNASLGKLLIADLKKQDDSFQVISRPQITTVVGVGAALDIQGGDGSLKLRVTPKRDGEDVMIDTHLTLIGRFNPLPPDEGNSGLNIEASSSQKCQPGTTAVMMLGGKDCERAIVVLTDLVHLRQARRPEPLAAQVLPNPWVLPRDIRQQPQLTSPNPWMGERSGSPSTTSRLVTLKAVSSIGLASGDTVDVLVVSAENGDASQAKVEMLCESLTVYQSTPVAADSTTSVTLSVDKDQVEKLLLGQLTGALRLSVHKSAGRHQVQSLPGPEIPGSRIVYRANEVWEQPAAPIQASGVLALPRPTPVTRQPKSEVQQVLDEVREMRKAIQGLREDMNQLRNSVDGVSSRATSEQKEIQIPQGQSRTIDREKRIARVDGFDTDIVGVHAKSPNSITVFGRRPGRSTVVCYFEDDIWTPEKIVVQITAAPLPDGPWAPQPPQAAEQEAHYPARGVGHAIPAASVAREQSAEWLSSTGSSADDAARKQIELALQKEISIEITDGTLTDTLRQLQKTAGVNIVLDSRALEEEGVATDSAVSLHLNGVTLRSALKILLSPFNLTTVIENEVLKVTSQLAAKGQQTVVAYRVVDLIKIDTDRRAGLDSLIELITKVVEPDSWQEVGGVGSVAPDAHTTTLVVRQTQDVHDEIQQLFAALRKWNPADQAATSAREAKFEPYQVDLSPLQASPRGPKRMRSGAIPHPAENPLDRVISVTFDGDSLEDVLRHVATAVDVQLSIDQDALDAEGVKKNVPVSLNVEHVRANSVLKLILEPLKLTAVLEEEKTLKVTSLAQLKERQSVRVYSVSHLVTDPEVIDLKKLNEVITSSIEPASWQVVGGAGTIAPNEKTQSLVIRQTEPVHAEIARLLEDLGDLIVHPEEAKAAASKVR